MSALARAKGPRSSWESLEDRPIFCIRPRSSEGVLVPGPDSQTLKSEPFC